jgi:carbohydrate-selective porin OprB
MSSVSTRNRGQTTFSIAPIGKTASKTKGEPAVCCFPDTKEASLNDQYFCELFQQLQLTEGIEITPNAQVIRNPALEPSDDWSVFFGLRLRAAL